MMPEPQTPVMPGPHRLLDEARLVRPFVGADDLEARLQGLGIDAHPLDGARCGALAAGDLGALEGRARRAGGGEQLVAVAQHDLGIGADIDDQGHLVGLMRRLRQDDAGGIGADMAGDAGQHEDAGIGMDPELDLRGPDGDRPVGRERERRPAQLGRIDAQQQMMHDRIADEGDLEDLAQADTRFLGDIDCQSIQRLAHGLGHLGIAAGIHHHIADPAHQILAESDLGIHQPGRGDDLAARHHYGFLAKGERGEKLAYVRDLLHVASKPQEQVDPEKAPCGDPEADTVRDAFMRCPDCGGFMRRIETVAPRPAGAFRCDTS